MYNSEKSQKSTVESKDILGDDDSFDDEPTLGDDEYLKRDRSQSAMRIRLRRSSRNFICLFVLLLALFVVVVCVVGGLFVFKKSPGGKSKPMIELLRMHYHEWKVGMTGKEKDFILEGEFYQQTEIDYAGETYSKLSIPSLLSSKSAVIVHDYVKKLSVIVNRDDGRCFVMVLNSTLVKPAADLYQIAKNIKAGYDSPDGEVVHSSYWLKMPAVKDIDSLGEHVFTECRLRETYRLQREDEPLALSKRSSCHFAGEQYCMGNAGTQYMELVTISQCIN